MAVSEVQQIEMAKAYVPQFLPVMRQMKANGNGAKYYDGVYEMIDAFQRQSGYLEEIQCGEQECSFCCHDLIIGSTYEIETLANRVKSRNGYINGFNDQKKETWNKLPFAQTACPLLKNGKCTQYEKRPIVCRNYNIRKGQDPNNCQFKGQYQEEVVLLPVKTIMIVDLMLSGNSMSVLNFELLGNDSSLKGERLHNGKFVNR